MGTTDASRGFEERGMNQMTTMARRLSAAVGMFCLGLLSACTTATAEDSDSVSSALGANACAVCQYQDVPSCGILGRSLEGKTKEEQREACNTHVDEETKSADCVWSEGRSACLSRFEVGCDRWIKGRTEAVTGSFSWGTDILQQDDQLVSCGSLAYTFIGHGGRLPELGKTVKSCVGSMKACSSFEFVDQSCSTFADTRLSDRLAAQVQRLLKQCPKDPPTVTISANQAVSSEFKDTGKTASSSYLTYEITAGSRKVALPACLPKGEIPQCEQGGQTARCLDESGAEQVKGCCCVGSGPSGLCRWTIFDDAQEQCSACDAINMLGGAACADGKTLLTCKDGEPKQTECEAGQFCLATANQAAAAAPVPGAVQTRGKVLGALPRPSGECRAFPKDADPRCVKQPELTMGKACDGNDVVFCDTDGQFHVEECATNDKSCRAANGTAACE
jgi:hypothetical protein